MRHQHHTTVAEAICCGSCLKVRFKEKFERVRTMGGNFRDANPVDIHVLHLN
jgi:hypothetical protein